MIKNLIAEEISKNLGHPPTLSQEILISRLSEFLTQQVSDLLFIIKGYAGTGKTSAISALVKTMEKFRLKFILMAPTGRAAKILSQYSGKPAYTIHKKIYRQKSSKDGFGKFVLEKNLYTNTIFIVDEASMISNLPGDTSVFGSGYLLDDLIQYVYNDKGCKLIISGDTAQLPPVGSVNSPALDKAFYGSIFKKITECELTEVVRQEQQSGILENATFLRELIRKGLSGYPRFNIKGFTDMTRVSGNELIDCISDSYETAGIEQTVVINRSNKRSNMYNSGIRSRILFREEELVQGDMLMVVKNNYYWLQNNDQVDFIANGDAVEILKIKRYEEIYGFRFADVKLRLIDYDLELDAKMMLDTLHVESASLTSDQNKNLFYTIYQDFEEIRPKGKGYKMVKDNPHFNALQVKFAYAVTCHKAQGGQWKNVFIDQGFIREDMMDTEYLRWLYTAVTRSTQNLYLINFPEKYFV
jgi:exodeoxyribonuclease-5